MMSYEAAHTDCFTHNDGTLKKKFRRLLMNSTFFRGVRSSLTNEAVGFRSQMMINGQMNTNEDALRSHSQFFKHKLK